MRVTIRRTEIPDGVVFRSGQLVTVKNLETGETVKLEIASGHDVPGFDENIVHSDGSVSLALVAPQQGG